MLNDVFKDGNIFPIAQSKMHLYTLICFRTGELHIQINYVKLNKFTHSGTGMLLLLSVISIRYRQNS